MKVIFDKNGAAYRIERDQDSFGPAFHLKIHDPHTQSSWIGHAKFLWDSNDTLKLADINMNPKAVIHFRKIRMLWKFSPVGRDDRNCQRMGLGTQLLEHSLECVKTMGVKRIWGNITSDDYQNNPNLPKWYASLGFDVKLKGVNLGKSAKIEIQF